MNAEDKIGWYYLVQTVAMAESIRLFDPRPASAKPEMRIVWEFTAWAVFGWQRYVSKVTQSQTLTIK